MPNRIYRGVARALLLAGLVAGGFARAQTLQEPQRGRTAREAMYLRLFQEVERFEATADSLEAQGTTAPHLRGYHQKWLSFSPAHAKLLKEVALRCVRDLRLQGAIGSGAGGPMRLPGGGRAREVMAVVASAVDSLAAAMGPAQFAYFDSTAHRYLESLVAGGPERAAVSGAGAVATGFPRASALGESCGGPGPCPLPSGEYSTPSSWCPTCIGGVFLANLLEDGVSPPPGRFEGRTVSEYLYGETDGCYFPGSAKDPIPDEPYWGSTWPVGGTNVYGGDDIGDDPAWVDYYYQAIWQRWAPYTSCSESDYQAMSIDYCDWLVKYEYDSGHSAGLGIDEDGITAWRGDAWINSSGSHN